MVGVCFDVIWLLLNSKKVQLLFFLFTSTRKEVQCTFCFIAKVFCERPFTDHQNLAQQNICLFSMDG